MSECIKFPLLSTADLANNDVFDRHWTTIYRWTRGQTKSLIFPAHDAVVAGERVWDVDTIRVWADERKLPIDEAAIERIRQSQVGVSVPATD